jgi:hypothetical protein
MAKVANRMPGIIAINRHSAKQERDIGAILPFSQNSIVNRRAARRGGE